MGGQSVWATHPHPIYDFAVREQIWKIIDTDPGGTNPMIEFLLWKQSLDPVRFDHYHPKIGPAIDRLVARAPKTPTQAVNPTTVSTGTSTPSEGQQLTGPVATPEPSTWIMTIGLAGWALSRRRRRAR